MKIHDSSLLLLLAFSLASFSQDRTVRFQGEVSRGREFRKVIGHGLVFVLDPKNVDGWMIAIEPQSRSNDASCRDFSGIVATPFHGYKATDLNTDYGYTAREAVGYLQREFSFVLNEADCKRELEWGNRLLWSYSYPDKEVKEAQEKFGSSASGTARFKILDSEVSAGGVIIEGKDLGKIDWVKFGVEITFPPGH
jgi:hypothetical protein